MSDSDHEGLDESLENTDIRISAPGDDVSGARGSDAPIVSVRDLRENLQQFVKQATYVVNQAALVNKKSKTHYEVSEFKVVASIEGSGQVGFFGVGASMTAAGQIELTFRKKA